MFTDVAYVHISSPPDADVLCRYDSRYNEPRKSFPNSKSATNFGAICGRPPRKVSSVMGQKLRESKWFTHEELKIVCAVLESGFIVQKSVEDEEVEDQWGIAMWDVGHGVYFGFVVTRTFTWYPKFSKHPIVVMFMWPFFTKLFCAFRLFLKK